MKNLSFILAVLFATASFAQVGKQVEQTANQPEKGTKVGLSALTWTCTASCPQSNFKTGGFQAPGKFVNTSKPIAGSTVNVAGPGCSYGGTSAYDAAKGLTEHAAGIAGGDCKGCTVATGDCKGPGGKVVKVSDAYRPGSEGSTTTEVKAGN